MNILVLNCGSSSLGFKVYQSDSYQVILSGKARNVATRTQAAPEIEWKTLLKTGRNLCALPSHRAAASEILAIIKDSGTSIDAIGHRFVHGGEVFNATTRINAKSLADLQKCLPLAPIHNPNSFSVIEVCLSEMPAIPQYVVFDTAFHAQLPVEAYRYALPLEISKKFGLRKFGFHGLSYQFVSGRASQFLEKPLNSVKLIMCHLGTGGSSVTAFNQGHSIETSMGYSPLTGLVMSTRCGDIDAEVVLELVRHGLSVDEVEGILNNQSGLIGLSGYSSNLAEIIEAAEQGNDACQVAFEVYTNRLKFYLGAYTWLLGGADAIVFTDDIGVKSWQLREKVCAGVENLGVMIDTVKNRTAPIDRESCVSQTGSLTSVLVIPTDEEIVIMEEVLKLL